MGKSKKDNVLKPNGISGPWQYIIQLKELLVMPYPKEKQKSKH